MNNLAKNNQMGIINPSLDYSKASMGCGDPLPTSKPARRAWACSCGALDQLGNLCTECGTSKESGVVKHRCGQCGWMPTNSQNQSDYCPECGCPIGETKPAAPEIDPNKYWRCHDEHF